MIAISTRTQLPPTLELQFRKAQEYLDHFAQFTDYDHGPTNPYIRFLRDTSHAITVKDAVALLNFWAPVSIAQPQILYRILASLDDWADRRINFQNVREEDGMCEADHVPHSELLSDLIFKLGEGIANPHPVAHQMVVDYVDSLRNLSAAEAVATLAAIEHPALTISDFLCTLMERIGRAELLASDPYLVIHRVVEPGHIICAAGRALDWAEDEAKQARLGYSATTIYSQFSKGMAFWNRFWEQAFSQLGYVR